MHMKKGLAALFAAMTLTAAPLSVWADVSHDLDGNGALDKSDCTLLCDYLLTNRQDIASQQADWDGDYALTAKDLTLMKRELLKPKQDPQNPQDPQTHVSGSEYMAQVRSNYVTEVPQDILNAKGGELQHITYFSTKANKEKGSFVWLPPGFDASQKYPVFYVNHGIQGSEYSMLGDFKILESAAGLIQKGEAVPMIIVFTFMYTNPNKDNCSGITADEEPFYDAFLEDLTDCLMPYIAEHYPVKTGRENTAVGGFSMGGRESLYIGVSRPDVFGYIAATSPAPGVTPAVDQFFAHPGSMSEDQFRIDAPYEPYLLMIAGGTADGMVNVSPENYSKLLTKNGTDHIFISVPGGGHDGSTGIPLFYNFIRALFKA
ncbi:MAG: hypothetical protein IK130_04535 [Oscillospiraceae bacterium]|nr:hypothetical protein [Oscillospiraceae bacterium]